MQTEAEYKKIFDTAILAGEIMLVSGAETYRVEDTMGHILALAKHATHTELALATSISISLESAYGQRSMTKRIKDVDTNLNRIYLVNQISRELSAGKLDIYEAYDILCDVRYEKLYSEHLNIFAHMGVCGCFAILLGGGIREGLLTALIALTQAAIYFGAARIRLNAFCRTLTATAVFTVVTLCIKSYMFTDIDINPMLIGGIMPLVPGVKFTTAIRDTLSGDYISGIGRIIESIVVSLAIASGTAFGMWLMGGI